MKKRTRLIIGQWSRDSFPVPEIPSYAYSKHLRRRAAYRYKNGTAIIDLQNGWYLHSYRNGIRMLSVLPF